MEGNDNVNVSTSSTKFLQNIGFGTLHIMAEVIALVGVSYYFFNKNKILMKHIEEIAQRLGEQDEILSKHDAILKKILATRFQSQTTTEIKPQVKSSPSPPPLQPPLTPQKVEVDDFLTSSNIVVPVPPPVEPSITEITNLDDEIEQELSDLKASE